MYVSQARIPGCTTPGPASSPSPCLHTTMSCWLQVGRLWTSLADYTIRRPHIWCLQACILLCARS